MRYLIYLLLYFLHHNYPTRDARKPDHIPPRSEAASAASYIYKGAAALEAEKKNKTGPSNPPPPSPISPPIYIPLMEHPSRPIRPIHGSPQDGPRNPGTINSSNSFWFVMADYKKTEIKTLKVLPLYRMIKMFKESPSIILKENPVPKTNGACMQGNKKAKT
jgi:hypothetical protein